MAALGVRPPALQPRAHSYIGQVIALAAGLLAREAAYQRDGQVYFRGAAAARRVGELVAVHVIPRPHEETEKVLPGAGPVKKSLG